MHIYRRRVCPHDLSMQTLYQVQDLGIADTGHAIELPLMPLSNPTDVISMCPVSSCQASSLPHFSFFTVPPFPAMTQSALDKVQDSKQITNGSGRLRIDNADDPIACPIFFFPSVR